MIFPSLVQLEMDFCGRFSKHSTGNGVEPKVRLIKLHHVEMSKPELSRMSEPHLPPFIHSLHCASIREQYSRFSRQLRRQMKIYQFSDILKLQFNMRHE